ncbi:MAG: transketolase [Planctomycetes bacterium]|nr:transketolase [Planctomycetota bacterium]
MAVSDIQQLSINTIRTLSMDAVQKATCGHPGTPMALAPVAYSLWNEWLRYDPSTPNWPARDRFVLSCGHASMLLYSVLHLAGVRDEASGNPAISLEDIKNFRQLGSPCAGHPELGEAAGIETTTGPLGQGVGNSVGLAMAAKWLSARYDRPGFELFDFNVFAFCSDGDIMEGLGCEAASFAGHLKLSNLCWVYDDNSITIEGRTDLAFSENAAQRFEGLGWNTVLVEDANDLKAINAAFSTFQETNDRPTFIILRSVIGFGSPNKADSHAAHGAALGEDEVRLTKQAYGWPEDEQFLVPDEVRRHFAEGVGQRGQRLREEWVAKFAEYKAAHAEAAEQLECIWSGRLPVGWDKDIPTFAADEKGMATRASSGQVLNSIAENLPWFVGGSADLAPSNNTLQKSDDAGHFGSDNFAGRNFHFGVREHAMAATCNGLSLAGLRPYAGTFFVFTDYMRPSMRLSSIMHRPVLYILTHDSIGLGEDGPTHQPIEHLAACRAIPGLLVMRPGDANEVVEAYRTVLPITDRPTAMVLTRQALPTLDRAKYNSADGVARGGYVLADAVDGDPDAILIGTGSELSLCVQAHEHLSADGIKTRVVSMPCQELFNEQDAAYRDSVLPSNVSARVAVEAGVCQGWEKYIGPKGCFVGMSTFGASAPLTDLYDHFGITADRVVEEVRLLLT